MAAGGHFRCPQITFDRISGHFRSIRQLFLIFFDKMAAGMSNACVKFEERSLNPSKVIALTKFWRGGGGGGCVADENIIFPKTYVSREYNERVLENETE